MNFNKLLKELEATENPDLYTYCGWNVLISELLDKEGWRLVHLEDSTIGITPQGPDKGWVRVYPGADIEYGQEIIRNMIEDNGVGVDDGEELYCIVNVPTNFNFVLSDPSSCEDDRLDDFIGNEYPDEYVEKVFKHAQGNREIVENILEMLSKLP